MDLTSRLPASLHEDDFRLIRDFIAEYSGIFFDDHSRYLLEKRLQKRLETHGLESFRDYYYRLIYSPDREDEVGIMLDVLTTNETYFFREDNQLKALSEEIIPEIVSGREAGMDKTIRIWSAGCSTGEEPYTLAILLMEHLQLGDWDKEIMATDISRRVLQAARQGVYGKPSFRSTSPEYIQRYFEALEDHRYRIKDLVRALVAFGHFNIIRDSSWPADGSFDIILCRNVLIYFNQEAKRKAADNLEKKLKPGGYLLLGHADSLMNISTSFMLRHFKHDLVYQKPGETGV